MSGVLDEIVLEFHDLAPLDIGTMFRNPAVVTAGKIAVFLGHNDRLILKLPRARAEELIATATVEPVTMGTRTMREWVAVRIGPETATTREAWMPLAGEAIDYVARLAGGSA